MNIRELLPSRSKREAPVRFRAGNPMLEFQSAIDRAFDDFWRTLEVPTPDGFAELAGPRIDVRETDKEFEVVAELPGMDEKDVDVSVVEGALRIRGEKKSDREEEEKGWVVRERSFGRIERVVPLPEYLDLGSAEAKFKNGVLTVRIAKAPEAQAAVKQISVERG